ncbi:MAG: tetraacyldisaccharide 4'-kinase [Sphingomonadales bacterium]
MFYHFFLRSFRIFLLPLSLLYWLIIFCRNWLYDKKVLRSASFGMPLITVGNLAIGGTGKSPLVEYLVGLLHRQYKVATLSRGYRRRTRGYTLATEATTALEIGDEPLALHRKFPHVPVAVGEERLLAIPELLHDHPETEVIVLDDAFQHRVVQAGLSILLTDYANLYTRDFYLPTGDLRDLKSRYKDANILIVTKCPATLTETQRNTLIAELSPLKGQSLFFTTLVYGIPYHLTTKKRYGFTGKEEILLVTGISNPRPLKQYIEEHSATYHQLTFRDHHIFSIEDFKDIVREFERIPSSQRIIITTEKDAVRLEKFNVEIDNLPWYVLPIEHRFLFDEQVVFDRLVIDFIEHFERPLS